MSESDDNRQHPPSQPTDTPESPDHENPPDKARQATPPPPPSSRLYWIQVGAALFVLLLAVLVVVLVIAPTSAPTPGSDTDDMELDGLKPEASSTTPPRPVTNRAALPRATTHTTVTTAPIDPHPSRPPTGRVAHPRQVVAVYSHPGGPAIAALPPRQVSSHTWLPVIDEEPGWVQVLLPSRPNSSSGWLSTQDSAIELATTPYRVIVDRAAFRMQLYRDGAQIGHWKIGIGQRDSETPAGRTFIMASFTDARQSFSPVILALGTHSTTHETYSGGPGTTGVHGWPTNDAFGRASSDGCIRVPSDALNILAQDVPIGTPVLIT